MINSKLEIRNSKQIQMIKLYIFPNNLVLDFDVLDLADLVCLRFRTSNFGF